VTIDRSAELTDAAQPSRRTAVVSLCIILLIAAILRLHDLTSHAYMLDEDWSLEIATGRGSVHQHLPTDQILSPPPYFSLNDAPPWWHIWSHMVFDPAAVLGRRGR
jgi:hypothetical protein